jgi:hypothetical protein
MPEYSVVFQAIGGVGIFRQVEPEDGHGVSWIQFYQSEGMTMKTKMIAFAAAGALSMTLAAPSSYVQDDSVRAGVLNCEVSGGAGFIFGSSKSLYCNFKSSEGWSEEYAGEINKFGIDIGVTGPAKLTWAVLAPTNEIGKGALAGSYVGASAQATAGVGAGANLLVGGSDDTISLQPLSVQGQTGVNAALGVAEIVLNPA